MRYRDLTALLLITLTFSGCCCPAVKAAREAAREAARRNASMNNMRQLSLAVLNYRDANGDWPDTLEDTREFALDFDMLMKNPLTEDNPGYEYVKPTDEKASLSETIILYPMRDGMRDVTLVGYADGSVRSNLEE